jgi:hypothetical protein
MSSDRGNITRVLPIEQQRSEMCEGNASNNTNLSSLPSARETKGKLIRISSVYSILRSLHTPVASKGRTAESSTVAPFVPHSRSVLQHPGPGISPGETGTTRVCSREGAGREGRGGEGRGGSWATRSVPRSLPSKDWRGRKGEGRGKGMRVSIRPGGRDLSRHLPSTLTSTPKRIASLVR